jgi:3-oxoacyl-[acyl-carrier protein] reductase
MSAELGGGTAVKKLDEKVVLVTGASRGIGEAIAYALAEEGANIAINYVKSAKKASELCESLQRKYGVHALAVQADVSVPNEVKAMVDAVLEKYGRIDVLVNNAGMLVQGKLVDTSVEDWNTMISIDLTGVFLCCRAVLPKMLERKSGRIINIASQLGQVGASELVAYSAAKGGVIAFTKALAREVAEDGILVNCVAPGPIETDMVAGLTKEWKATKLQMLPLGRFGQPKEVAPAVVFLASSDSAIFVGQTLGPNSGDVML